MAADKATEIKQKYCKAKWDAEKAVAEADIKADELWTKIKAFCKLFFSSKSPLLGALAALGNELLGAIAAAAAGLVGSMFALASAALAKVMEKIFGLLLMIIMAGPDALLSMLILPMSRATTAADQEAIELCKAQGSLGVCMSILRKWADKVGSSSEQYLQQMQAALSPIQDVINGLAQVLTSLQKNSFDEAAYNAAMQRLDFSIFLTEPSSSLSRTIDINGRMDVIEQQIFAEKMTTIDKQKEGEYLANDANYRSRVDPYYAAQKDITNPDFYSGKSAVDPKLAGYVADWEYQKKAIDLKYDGKELTAHVQAKTEAYDRLGDIFKNIGDDIKAEFEADVAILKKQSSDMILAIKEAAIRNKECQLYTQAAYNGIDRIKKMIAFLIKLMNGNTFGAGSIARVSVELGRELAVKARARLDDRIKTYEEDYGNVFNAKSIVDLSFSNTQLKTARAIMDGAITQQMMDMLNFDEKLGDEAAAFTAFQGRVYSILDWDNVGGRWGVDAEAMISTPSPYLVLVGDIVKIGTTILIPNGTQKSMRLVAEVDKSIGDIANHNAYVKSVLYSWAPPTNTQSEELRKTLEQFGGVMAQFFMLLDLAAFFGKAIAQSVAEKIDRDKITNLDDCSSIYDDFIKKAEQDGSISPKILDKMKENALKNVNNINSASKNQANEEDIGDHESDLRSYDVKVMDPAMAEDRTIKSDMTGIR